MDYPYTTGPTGPSGGYTYDDFVKAATDAGLMEQFSPYDLSLAQMYPEAGLSILSLKQDYGNATTDEQRILINEAANQVRNSFGAYTGGRDGSKYYAQTPRTQTSAIDQQINDVLGQIGSYDSFNYGNNDAYIQALNAVAQAQPFSYDAQAPTYSNAYSQLQQQLLSDLLNRQEFSYDKETDPQWASYKKSYLREGDRATSNALAQASAASGGRPSSYAVNAATQAGDYYATKLNDIIPTLYQQAYDRYLQEYQMKQSDLNAVNTQEQLDYAKYLDQLGQYNTDRSFALNQYAENAQQRLNALNALSADRDFAYNDYLNGYNMLQSYLGNLQGQSDTIYSRALDEADRRTAAQQYADQLARQALADKITLAELGGAYGDYAGLNALGITPNMNSIYEAALANAGRITPVGSGGSGSSGGGSGGGSGGRGGTTTTTTNESATGDQATIDAFNNGDHSDDIIKKLLAMGYTQADLEAAGYRGNYFKGGSSGQQTSTSSNSRLASFDYDEDEGIFTWAGRQYSDVNELAKAINSARLSMDEKIALTEKMRRFGLALDIN